MTSTYCTTGVDIFSLFYSIHMSRLWAEKGGIDPEFLPEVCGYTDSFYIDVY